MIVQWKAYESYIWLTSNNNHASQYYQVSLAKYETAYYLQLAAIE
jgi:hypothetical protein